jgi:hypothetical protein
VKLGQCCHPNIQYYVREDHSQVVFLHLLNTIIKFSSPLIAVLDSSPFRDRLQETCRHEDMVKVEAVQGGDDLGLSTRLMIILVARFEGGRIQSDFV